jgi:hypothetical protein
VSGVVLDAEKAMEGVVARALEGQAEKAGARDAVDAVRTAGDALPVDEDNADDFAERQRHDGQVVAAKAQDREAERHAPKCGEEAGER